MAETLFRRVALFDFDCTLTRFDTVKLLTLILLVTGGPLRGVKAFRLWRHPGLGFQDRKASAIGALIAGRSVQAVERVLFLFRIAMRCNLFKSVTDQLLACRKDGVDVCIVSASPAFAVRSVLNDQSIAVIGIEYLVLSRRYTGVYVPPVPYGSDKVHAVLEHYGQNVSFVAAYSDSISDAPLLELADDAYMVDRKGVISRWCK